jgi:hypothetical protein
MLPLLIVVLIIIVVIIARVLIPKSVYLGEPTTFLGGDEGRPYSNEQLLECFNPDTIKIIKQDADISEQKTPPMFLSDLTQRIKYYPTKCKKKDCVVVPHLGQRKLLLTEVYFLSQKLTPTGRPWTVVYIGAGLGTHNRLMFELFNNLTCGDSRPSSGNIVSFHLFDKTFDPVLEECTKGTPNITIHRKYFTDELAADVRDGKYGDPDQLLFMSDIRTLDNIRDSAASEQSVRENQEQHETWVNTIRPRSAFLKFRVPFDMKGDYYHFDAPCMLQPWVGHHSTETRLIVDKPSGEYPITKYDPTEFEEKLHYHNVIHRGFTLYKNKTSGESNSDNCYDCAAESIIWQGFINSKWVDAVYTEGKPSIDSLIQRASQMKNNDRGLVVGRHPGNKFKTIA